MEDLKNKRLLILGGQSKMCDIVRRARELGVYTVVTDWYENSPAKRVADRAYDISISDVDRLLALIREEHIDGVFTGFIDSYLPHYLEICERAGLHCYLSREQLLCSTDKQYFKRVCREVGIDTIPEADLSDPLKLRYPVVIKPVDNSGSKGITVCSDSRMIAPARDRALRFSRSKRYLSERFLDCDYVAAYYTVKGGVPNLTLLLDKDTNRVGRGKVPYPVAYVAPSRYRERYLRRTDGLVRRLAERLGMRDGTFLISFFVDGDHFYAVEMASRLTATREYVFTGEDVLGMYIRFALTGVFASEERRKTRSDGGIQCMLLHFISEGTIERVEGIEEIRRMDGLLDVLQYRDVGATIRADGSYGQLFCRVYLTAETTAEMIDRVEQVQRCLYVRSADQRPMLFTGFDARSYFRN